MEKIEYKVTRDKDFTGKRHESYTVEKIITHENGEVEHRYRVVFPFKDGSIDKINLDQLEFQTPITLEEFRQLPEIYRNAYNNGTMTEEIRKYGLSCLALIREGVMECI